MKKDAPFQYRYMYLLMGKRVVSGKTEKIAITVALTYMQKKEPLFLP
jgi:hypothetical protein